MGIPIQLIAVVNPNDIVHRTFKYGDLSIAKDVKPTWASAMDIQVRIIAYMQMNKVYLLQDFNSNRKGAMHVLRKKNSGWVCLQNAHNFPIYPINRAHFSIILLIM